MTRSALPLVLSLVIATVALAHEGVQNPAVMARMEGMKNMADAAKVMGGMARGTAPFDAAAAEAALAKLSSETARITPLFAAPEDDPKSEALPAIWEDFDTFAARAADLEATLQTARGINTLDDLTLALQEIGKVCAGCHEDYTE